MKKSLYIPVCFLLLSIPAFVILPGLTGCVRAEPDDTEDVYVSLTVAESGTETENESETATESESESETSGSGGNMNELYYLLLELTHPMNYSEYVDKYSEKYNVPKDVIYAIIKSESGFRYDAVSSKDARGLMQLLPETYEWLCGREGLDPEEHSITDPEINIMLGTSYLAYLYGEFGVWETVYAAYNAGQGIVRKWLEDEQYGKDGLLVNIPFTETKLFVKKVSNARQTYALLLQRNEETADEVTVN